MKEVDLTSTVRKDPFTGEILHETCNENARNRYNILAVVTLKYNMTTVEAVVYKRLGHPVYLLILLHIYWKRYYWSVVIYLL